MTKFKSSRFLNWGQTFLALVPGAGILILISLSNQEYAHNGQAVLALLQAPFAVAFGVVFFAPAWSKLPLQQEGEFFYWRYADGGVSLLSAFRNGLIALFVAPLLMALIITSVLNWHAMPTHELPLITEAIIAVLLLLSIFNSLRRRLHMDAVVGLASLIATAIFMVLSFTGVRTTGNFWETNLAPLFSSLPASEIALSLGMVWWFAGSIDIPDMRAQKLLAYRDMPRWMNPMLLAAVTLAFIQGWFLMFPISTGASFSIDMLLLILLLMNALVALLDLQHWAGATLMLTNFTSYFSNKRQGFFSVISMFLCTVISYFFVRDLKHSTDVVMRILFFSAGVGPVYILRWTWWRINAWSQLAAMLGALFLGVIWPWLLLLMEVKQVAEHALFWNVFVPGLLNSILWLSVLYCTRHQTPYLRSMRKVAESGVLRLMRRWQQWLRWCLMTLVLLLLLYWPAIWDAVIASRNG